MVEFFLILSAISLYFMPLLVAAWVRHPKLAYIGGLNAALGVTVVGWAGALIWALRRRRVVAVSYHGDMAVPRSFNMRLLVAGGLVVGVAMVATYSVNWVKAHKTDEAAAGLYAADAVTAAQWQYTTTSGARVASLASSNSISPPAPFKGGPVVLGISQGPDGPVVKLDTDAELACSYAPTASSIEVNFDGGPGVTFDCAPAPAGARQMLFDGDHSTAYLADPQAFLSRLKGVRHITLTTAFSGVMEPQAVDYDLPAGSPVLETAAAPQVPAAKMAAAAAPALVMAAVSTAPAAAQDAAVSDEAQAGRDAHKHHKHGRHGNKTYVDGVPARSAGHGRHHRHRA